MVGAAWILSTLLACTNGAAPVPPEAYWPARASLVRDWTPPGHDVALSVGSRAIVVRLEKGGRVRLDFGRNGRFSVPLEVTDVVARASAIERGDATRGDDNFLGMIASRVWRTGPGVLPEPHRGLKHDRWFIAVFAAVDGKELAALAEIDWHGLLPEDAEVIVFGQGRHTDEALRLRLAGLGWWAPQVVAHNSAAITDTLFDPGFPLPRVTVFSRQGRVALDLAGSKASARLVERSLRRFFESLRDENPAS